MIRPRRATRRAAACWCAAGPGSLTRPPPPWPPRSISRSSASWPAPPWSRRFKNASEDWVEGIYVFPLPERAAVDHLRMKVGERVIEGVIREREAARAEYERAKETGHRATLVEQERPNMFTSSVANLGPGEEVRVEIELQETLAFDEGEVRLRFPLVVGPALHPWPGDRRRPGGSRLRRRHERGRGRLADHAARRGPRQFVAAHGPDRRRPRRRVPGRAGPEPISRGRVRAARRDPLPRAPPRRGGARRP